MGDKQSILWEKCTWSSLYLWFVRVRRDYSLMKVSFFKKLKVLPNGNLIVGQMSSRSLGCCGDLNMSWKRGEDHEKINMAPP